MPNGEFTQIVHRPIVDVQVYCCRYAFDTSEVRVLPELPFAFVAHFLGVVVGNPKGIAVKFLCVEMGDFEVQPCVNDRGSPIFLFQELQSLQSFFAQLSTGQLSLLLNVQHGR